MGQSQDRKKSGNRFPLYLHRGSGQWSKKIKKRTVYFGVDQDAALARWLAEKDYLLAGLAVRSEPKPAHATVATLCRAMLHEKQSLLDARQFSLRTFKQYREVTQRLLDHFGPVRLLIDITPADLVEFRLKCAANVSPVTCAHRLRYVRAILKFAFENDLVPTPIKFHRSLSLPSQSVIRAERHKRGKLLFSASEIRLMLNGGVTASGTDKTVSIAAASPSMRAFVLLGINCGFGQTDIARLDKQHVDLENGWHVSPRNKTGMPRRAKLWPETVAAIRDYLKIRPERTCGILSNRLFVTPTGKEFVRVVTTPQANGQTRITPVDIIGPAFADRLVKLNLKRPNNGFYTLRRVFRTVADEARDQPAAMMIMGHVPESSDMSHIYRQSISDERLNAVSDYVRNWLFGTV